jgi:hypothetical protein
MRMLLFDRADGVFVERGAADAHAGRGAIPVEDARFLTGMIGVQQKRIFVAAAIACES